MSDLIVHQQLTVQILHNVTTDEAGRATGWTLGYRRGDQLARVLTYSAPAKEPTAMCEDAFRIFNVDPEHLAEEERALATQYRAHQVRSLSMGDVVVIGETAWACARFGWENVSLTSSQISGHTPE